MSLERKVASSKKRRILRVRSRLTKTFPRVTVFRSLKHIYAQLIDDAAGKTLASASSLEIEVSGNKTDLAHQIGLALAKKAQEQGISQVVFDRGQFLYHGRVKSLAEGLRVGGLKV